MIVVFFENGLTNALYRDYLILAISTSEEVEKSGFGESSQVCKPVLLSLPDRS